MKHITQVNELYISKSLNSGYVFFLDLKKAEAWRDVLQKERVQYITFIWKINNLRFYAFRMFRMKYQFLTLCARFKEVMGDENFD